MTRWIVSDVAIRHGCEAEPNISVRNISVRQKLCEASFPGVFAPLEEMDDLILMQNSKALRALRTHLVLATDFEQATCADSWVSSLLQWVIRCAALMRAR